MTFICGSVACRLEHDWFVTELKNWLKFLSVKKFVTFFSKIAPNMHADGVYFGLLGQLRKLVLDARFKNCDIMVPMFTSKSGFFSAHLNQQLVDTIAFACKSTGTKRVFATIGNYNLGVGVIRAAASTDPAVRERLQEALVATVQNEALFPTSFANRAVEHLNRLFPAAE